MSPKFTSKKTITDYNFSDKRVIIRVDFNVPFQGTEITDTFRITSALPTIKHILTQNPKQIILISHLGRPNGKNVPSLSFKPLLPSIQNVFSEHGLPNSIGFLDLPLNSNTFNISQVNLPSDQKLFLLENIRFHPEEESKTVNETVKRFRSNLTSLGDVFVFDAFGCAHRAHSSVVGVDLERLAGFLMEKECLKLGQFIEFKTGKTCLLLGGAKVADKILLIKNMLDKISILIIGGAMANTFLFHSGYHLGESFMETSEETKKLVDEIRNLSESKGVELVLPVDLVSENKKLKLEELTVEEVKGEQFCDIGKDSVELFFNKVSECSKVFWNGPMGKFEDDRFNKGTFELLERLSTLEVQIVIGGGDTASAAKKIGKKLGEHVYVSTGGGASLEFLEGKSIPGMEALSDK